MDKKTKTNTSIKKILIFSGIGFFIMFLFLNSVFETPEQKEHNERIDYIKQCAYKAQNRIEDYNYCMSKRPDIR